MNDFNASGIVEGDEFDIRDDHGNEAGSVVRKVTASESGDEVVFELSRDISVFNFIYSEKIDFELANGAALSGKIDKIDLGGILNVKINAPTRARAGALVSREQGRIIGRQRKGWNR